MHRKYQTSFHHIEFAIRLLLLSILFFAILSGCKTAPVTEKTATRPPVFFPPLPNSPRIQYLATFSSANDLKPPASGFFDFIVGQEKNVPSVSKPYGTAMHDGKIFVVDTRGPGYAVFDLVTQKFNLVTGSGGGTMQKPINIAIDKDGTRYITDTGREQVLAYDRNDQFVRAYGKIHEFKPAGITVTNDLLFVSDLKQQQIVVIDKQSGDIRTRFGTAGSKPGELFFPTNITIGPNGNLFVADTGNFRVEEFTTSGEYLRSFGSVGISLGSFARPKGVALDRNSRMYVVDAAFENVQLLDNNGNLLLFFGSPGEAPENINLPTAIFLDYDNVAFFKSKAAPGFRIEYLILIASQFGLNKVNVYGFGRMDGMDYSEKPVPPPGVNGNTPHPEEMNNGEIDFRKGSHPEIYSN